MYKAPGIVTFTESESVLLGARGWVGVGGGEGNGDLVFSGDRVSA